MRPRKADKYDEQRETICQKIIKILELDENGEFIGENMLGKIWMELIVENRK